MTEKLVANPLSEWNTDNPLTGTVYVSEELYDAEGSYPAMVVGEHLRGLFSRQYWQYTEIYVMDSRSDCPSLDTQDVNCDENDIDTSDTTPPLEDFESYLKTGPAPREEDLFNLCITNHPHDPNVVGCGEVGGNVAVSEGGGQIADKISDPGFKRYHEANEGTESLLTAIHEVGHNLNIPHDTGHQYVADIEQSDGEAYIETPFHFGGGDNLCGEKSVDRDGQEKYLEMLFSECALSHDYIY